MRKLCSILLCLLLVGIIGLTAFAAANDTKIYVTADKTEVHRGGTVQITVSMSGSDPFTSMGYLQDADSEYFTVGNHTFGDALEEAGRPAIKNFSKKNGFVVGSFTDWDTEEDIAVTVNGVFLTFSITIKENAPAGQFTITDLISIKNHTTTISCQLIEDTITVVDASAACEHNYQYQNTGDTTFHSKVCSKCSDTISELHGWDAGVITKQPTTTAAGEKTFTCNQCGSTKTEKLPMLETPDAEVTTFTVTADKTEVQRGDTVNITVSLSGTDPFTSIGYLHNRDSEYFTVSKGVLQPALEKSGNPAIKNFSPNTGLAVGGFVDYDTNKDVAVTVNGDILVMTITIKEDAPIGSFTVTDLIRVKNHINQLPCELIEDTITVAAESDSCEHAYQAQNTGSTTTHALVCAYCGNTKTAAHTWNAGEITKQPTYTTKGEKTFTCTLCGGTKTEILPILSNPGSGDTKITVTADKTEVKPGDTVQITVSMSGTDPFTSIGYLPMRNSTYFTIGKHTFGDALEEHGAASIKNFSKNTGLAVGGFSDYETEEDIAVVVNGVILTFQITINEDAPVGQFTITELASVKNHVNTLKYTLTESTITVLPACEHAYQAQNTGSTTTHALVCAYCGNTKTAAHTWNAGVITKQPTYTTKGEKTFTCTLCGASKIEYIPRLESDGSANDTKLTVTVDKTVVNPGDTVNVTITVTGTDPFTSMGYVPNGNSAYFTIGKHTFGDALEENGAAGIKNFSKNTGLAVGGFSDYDTEEDIAVTMNGVILTFTITIKEDAPVGQFQITKFANFKNGADSLLFKVIDPTLTVSHCVHTYSEWVESGNIHKQVCSQCGAENTASHTWDNGKVTTPPNCTVPGEKTFTCTACAATKTEPIPTNDDHTWDAGVITLEPTCTKTGVKTFTCATCATTKTEVIPATGAHSFENPTKVDDNTHKLTCICGSAMIVPHTWDAGKVTTEPTCKETGIKTYTCVCSAEKTETLPVTENHSFSVWIPDDGNTHSRSCTVCEKVEIGNHNFVNGVCTVCGWKVPYVITFLDENGTELSKATYHYGDTVTAPAAPSKAADKTYTYAFAGWDQEVVAVTGDATYTATYTATYIDYTVIFADEDGKELAKNTYHYGDTVTAPAAPSKAADKTYTYAFAGWDKEVVAVAGNATYTATYKATYIDYTVIFADEDGTQLAKNTYHYGDTVTVPAAPSKAADKTYTYAFAGWDQEVIAVTGNATYTATYTATYIDYTVIFADEDGTQLAKNTYHYGDTVTVPAAPSKAADKTYTYAFAGWDKEVVAVAGNATYTATYKATYIDYTVIFADENGAELAKNTYHYGDTVTVPAAPSKAADKTYTYAFAGWDQEVVAVTGNATYTATYTATYIDYTVIFADENGKELSKNTYHYGDTVTVPAAPSKAADKTYTYAFAGWDQEVVAVTGDATYTATYTATYIDYTVKFVYDDGTVIQEATYHYGDTVTVPANPQKAPAVDGTYTFTGWDKEITSVTEDATYTAQFVFQKTLPDFTQDGKVTDADAIYLLRHTLFPKDYPLVGNGDINCDGKITDADAIYLLRHTLFPEDFPLYPKKKED